jgi:hypothetical protein
MESSECSKYMSNNSLPQTLYEDGQEVNQDKVGDVLTEK